MNHFSRTVPQTHIQLPGAAVHPWVRSCQCLPESVEHSAIAEDADQAVLHSDIMEEGTLRIRDERIGDPQQRNQPSIQTQTFISREYQSGILPSLS